MERCNMEISLRDYLGINSFGYRPDGTKLSHEEQFSAIVNLIGLDRCIGYIPFTKEEIQEAIKNDYHLNTTDIKEWEDMHKIFPYQLVNKKSDRSHVVL